VRVGTRFVATVESAAHPRDVDALIEAADGATELTVAYGVGWPDAPHRVLASALDCAAEAADVVGSMLGPDGEERDVVRWFVSPPTLDFTGDIEAMALYAGTHLSPITQRRSAADIIAELLGT
jgi:nitronate monooxygenase